LRAGVALIGHVCREMKRRDEAEQAFRRVIGFDRLHPDAHLRRTCPMIARSLSAKAAQLAVKTVGLRYDLPWAHH